MSYKGLIIKLQKLYAYYDNVRLKSNIYAPSKQECDLICKEIDNLLISEIPGMRKHFKY